MKPKKLKNNIPSSAKEWLEYQEHRDRWTPEMQRVLDKHIRKTFPVTLEDAREVKQIKTHLATSHLKKPS
jgi:hypothetical protein